jgi:hypothetical protein
MLSENKKLASLRSVSFAISVARNTPTKTHHQAPHGPLVHTRVVFMQITRFR